MYRWIGRLTGGGAFMRGLRAALLLAPRWLVFFGVSLLGRAIHACAPRLRRRILANMRTLLPQASERERRRLCRQYVVHECLTIYEQTIEYRAALSAEGPRRADFVIEGQEHLDAALREGRGAIVYAPHLGNYFYQYWLLSQKYDCTTVVTAGSPELRELFVRVYSLGGMAGYDYDSESPRELAFKLRAHLRRNGVVFLLGDFCRPEFPDCSLFGRPSKLPGGAAALALLQKAPVLPFCGLREGWYRHRLIFEPALCLHERYGPDRKTEALDALARRMERLILRAPQQWLYWFNVHERWGEPPPEQRAAPHMISAQG